MEGPTFVGSSVEGLLVGPSVEGPLVGSSVEGFPELCPPDGKL